MSAEHEPVEGIDPERLRTTLRSMLAHPDRRFRMLAMRKLLDAPPENFAAILIDLSKDPYHGVRSVVTWAFGKLRDRTTFPRLCELLDDPDPWVRKNAALALARSGAHEALPALMRLREDPDRLVRGVAGWATRLLESLPTPPLESESAEHTEDAK